MITFTNQPKLSDHEFDREHNQRRLALVSDINKFIQEYELFKEKHVSVEFAATGVSSLVSFITTDNNKYVLKIPLRSTAEGEALFLKKWEEAGVAVPHVFGEGFIGGHPYILMSFIDAPLVSKVPKDPSVRSELQYEMGKTLSLMHVPKTNGFGLLVRGAPQYSTFKDWVEDEWVKEKIEIIQTNNILSDEHGPIDIALAILTAYTEDNPVTSYCHFDFGSNNLLATKPVTVIDPDASLNIGVMDLARTLILSISGGAIDGGQRFKDGYLSDGKSIDPKVLQAALVLNAYIKLSYWHQKDKVEPIERVRKYLAETRPLLGL